MYTLQSLKEVLGPLNAGERIEIRTKADPENPRIKKTCEWDCECNGYWFTDDPIVRMNYMCKEHQGTVAHAR